jgi:hypothetical protein
MVENSPHNTKVEGSSPKVLITIVNIFILEVIGLSYRNVPM